MTWAVTPTSRKVPSGLSQLKAKVHGGADHVESLGQRPRAGAQGGGAGWGSDCRGAGWALRLGLQLKSPEPRLLEEPLVQGSQEGRESPDPGGQGPPPFSGAGGTAQRLTPS